HRRHAAGRRRQLPEIGLVCLAGGHSYFMSDDESAVASIGGLDQFSPSITRTVVERVAPILRRWFRAELRGLDSFPTEGGALVVSNHSGGMLTPDVMLFGSAFYNRFGYD